LLTTYFNEKYLIMKLAIFSLTLGAASAFAPFTSHASITSLSMSEEAVEG
jgi:hypothetical protein